MHDVIWFLSHEMSGIGKSTETESRLVVTRDWESGKWGVTANKCGGSFWEWGKCSEVSQWWWLPMSVNKTKTPEFYGKWVISQFYKRVNFMVCELYLNKAVILKKLNRKKD